MPYICKPVRVGIYINSKRLTPAQIKKETGCDALVNGGLFDMTTFKPVCHLKVEGVVQATAPWSDFGLCWEVFDVRLAVVPCDAKNYISCVCILRGGKTVDVSGIDAALKGSRPRTGFGVMADGRVWLYADKSGKTPEQLAQIAIDGGVTDALMLDGGGSTQGVFPSGAVTSTRIVQNYICVWDAGNAGKTEDKMKTVCIDPGHGGTESANGSPDGSYKEHEFTLDLALRIRKLLTGKVNVLLTRSVDMTVALNKRAQIANEGGADCFVSLHSNAAAGTGWSDAHGLCAYTYAAGGERDKLANAILDELGAAGVELRATRLNHAKFTVLANTKMPAVLVEYLFHNNREDVAKLKDSAFRDKLAKATAKGICNYLGVAWDEGVEKETHIYRVQAGAFSDRANAEAYKQKMVAAGFSGAFIVTD